MINLSSLFASFIKANSPKANSASPSGLARAVAVLVVSLGLGIGLSESADSTSIDSIAPKRYIRLHYSLDQAKCLIKLYGKESAFNPKAIGNEDGVHKAYGIPQLKSEFIKDLSANRQIDYGMKYIDHRYAGKPCKALAHSRKHGWY
jgi:hypothetical protein